MAGKDGHKTPALRESLLSEGHRYSFVQAYRLLRLLVLGTPSVTVGQGEARIAISPFLSSDSPETEVAAISACPSQEEEEYTISAPFPPAFREALSSLPASYSEDLLREISSGRTRARDSLELLARPLYRLFFDAWAKHRLSYGIIEKGDGDCLERLLCLAGIPFLPSGNVSPTPFLCSPVSVRPPRCRARPKGSGSSSPVPWRSPPSGYLSAWRSGSPSQKTSSSPWAAGITASAKPLTADAPSRTIRAGSTCPSDLWGKHGFRHFCRTNPCFRSFGKESAFTSTSLSIGPCEFRWIHRRCGRPASERWVRRSWAGTHGFQLKPHPGRLGSFCRLKNRPTGRLRETGRKDLCKTLLLRGRHRRRRESAGPNGLSLRAEKLVRRFFLGKPFTLDRG